MMWRCTPLPGTQVKYFKGTFQDPNTFVQLPLQSAVHREIARMFMLQVRCPALPWLLHVHAPGALPCPALAAACSCSRCPALPCPGCSMAACALTARNCHVLVCCSACLRRCAATQPQPTVPPPQQSPRNSKLMQPSRSRGKNPACMHDLVMQRVWKHVACLTLPWSMGASLDPESGSIPLHLVNLCSPLPAPCCYPSGGAGGGEGEQV